MSTVDELIRERLRKLKEEEEQAAGSSVTSQKSQSIPKPQKKNNVEQVDDLLKELSEETVLEEAYGKDKAEIDAQIRRRLERLKVWDLGPPRASFKEIGRLKSVSDVVNEVLSRPDIRRNENDEDDDDKDSGKMSADDGTSSDDSDSPPNYCVFCKSEPSIVCIDCYKDSYCSKCFNEFHEPEDEHKTFPYQQKKKK